MTKRLEEEFCEGVFTEFLKDRHGLSTEWDHEPNGHATFPDFHMRYGGRTIAVEVTAFMTMYEQAGRPPVSDLGIWKPLERLAEDVEREAIAAGALRGTYILTVDGPYDEFFKATKELKKLLYDFIAATREVDQVPMTVPPLVTPSGQRYLLQKCESSENQVGIAMLDDGEAWGYEVAKQLGGLVQAVIATKAQKLKSSTLPCVLLLLDRYHLGTEREYGMVRDHVARLGAASPARAFHSVYLLDGQRRSYALHPAAGGDWGDSASPIHAT
ncbi:MAG TPA: hypothetical protein VHC22_01705 [Pirellulales bacterium]|nr:hypothetical protein [Pirellulales bacterium]